MENWAEAESEEQMQPSHSTINQRTHSTPISSRNVATDARVFNFDEKQRQENENHTNNQSKLKFPIENSTLSTDQPQETSKTSSVLQKLQRFFSFSPSNSSSHGDFEPIGREAAEYSLAYIKTTPKSLATILPVLCLLTHGAFLYGQIQIMWYLFFQINIDVRFAATSVESKIFYQALGWPNPLIVNISHTERLEEFTYGYAIQRLWAADHLENVWGPRFGALILILFSGIWPHLKLLMLQYYYYAKISDRKRSLGLYWLSALGKYSIADVFLVCVLIAVCNLHMNIEPDMVIKRIETLTPKIVEIIEKSVSEKEAMNDICNELLQLNCTLDSFHNFEHFNSHTQTINQLPLSCQLCTTTVSEFYANPTWFDTFVEDILYGIKGEGTGFATLRVAGLAGLHVFCVAVISSLLLGVVVDIFAHRAKAYASKFQ